MAPLSRFALTCLAALLLAGTAQASPSVEPIDPAQHQQYIAQLRQQARAAVALAPVTRAQPTGRASISLQPMFSAQAGSWPFEPFVNNGLFRAIAGYQAHHPQAVVLRGGSITLAQLHDALHDPRILKRYKDGYLLSYPLLIGADAGLLIEDTHLYLYSFSGTALINQGWLGVQRATLTSKRGDLPGATQRAWRPFVVAWAGSHTQLIDARLLRLGYNANLSRGLTTALSTQQPASTRPATLRVDASQFSELSSAVELQHSQALISASRFEQSQQYAIDARDSQLSLRDNQLRGIDNNSGVRLRGQTRALLEGNLILGAAKAAIEISDQRGAVLLAGNRIGDSRGNGIQLRNLAPSAAAPLLIDANLLASSQGSAIDAAEVTGMALVDNRIGNTPEYALSLRNSTRQPGPLLVSGNRLGQVGKALVRVEGVDEVWLGGNTFAGKALLQNLLIGDLLPVQGQVLEATVAQGRMARVRQQ
ncbi:right-handed parallel beta-helix repeat-containing protein [Pseudomonas muyukensis]|uniref:Right-handed parallel beta-helix repeat-containing protein n=1 Tax=Pseudomonas muyukensis TaxID=2842357 RepID=A0ABX8MEE0_9PSED|nr:right-handed parallel beta-helix repeat-containing protein [Pseudomonas muyukensis]QXH37446.1 right-handed parallel beta-helix repeat-containing protein [Pseudomonas muyukensis]